MRLKDPRSEKPLIWHQVSKRTWTDRYPEIFAQCQTLMKPKKILSFGCSTGEECASLDLYFPDATIYGADINDDALAEAQDKFPKFTFLQSYYENLAAYGPYDAIFAMNVLHRGTQGAEMLPPYLPCDFQEQIDQLVSLLVSGGHLVTYKAAYPVEHSDIVPIQSGFEKLSIGFFLCEDVCMGSNRLLQNNTD